MNKDRRKQLKEIVAQLEPIKDVLVSIMEDEESYRDAMPESLQESQRFSDSEEASDVMEAAVDSIGEAVDGLQGIF